MQAALFIPSKYSQHFFCSMKSTIQNIHSSSLFSKLCRKLSPNKTTTPTAPPVLSVDNIAVTPKCSQLERLFQHFDEDGDGKISPSELQTCLRTVGGELSSDEAVSVVESMDSDGDGFLGFDDFTKLMDCEGEEEKIKDLREAFRMYTVDGSGTCITPKSLRKMLSRLGVSKTIEQCIAIICRFDLDGDGVLSFEEFTVMMSS